MPQQVLTACKRVVVKIGSSLVASPNGGLRLDRIGRLAEEFGGLQTQNRQLVLVSSGAIVAGISHLGLNTYPQEVPLQQAAAAVGQSRLMRAYEMAFEDIPNAIQVPSGVAIHTSVGKGFTVSVPSHSRFGFQRRAENYSQISLCFSNRSCRIGSDGV